MVREEGDTHLASQISRMNPGDQWGDRCHSQIALTSFFSNFIANIVIPSIAALARSFLYPLFILAWGFLTPYLVTIEMLMIFSPATLSMGFLCPLTSVLPSPPLFIF